MTNSCLQIVDTWHGHSIVIVPLISPLDYRGMTARCSCNFMSTAWASCGNFAPRFLAIISRVTIIIIRAPKWQSMISLVLSSRSAYSSHIGIVCCYCDVSIYNDFAFFQNCHGVELNKIIEATMPINLYAYRMVYLWRPRGEGEWDVVRPS